MAAFYLISYPESEQVFEGIRFCSYLLPVFLIFGTWSYRILLVIISTSSTAKYRYTKYFWRCQIEPRAAPRAIRNLPSEQSLVPVAEKYQWESF